MMVDRKDKIVLTLLFLLIITLICLLTYIFTVEEKLPSKEDVIIEKIEKLENQISVLSMKKDSIRTIIVTTDKEIIKNTKHYEEVVNNIINQPDSVNYEWARNYISKFINERTR